MAYLTMTWYECISNFQHLLKIQTMIMAKEPPRQQTLSAPLHSFSDKQIHELSGGANRISQLHFLSFMQAQIDEIRALGRQRTAETYATALRSFARFLKGTDLLLDHFVPEVMMAYEAYLQSCGVCRNTSSFYMRNLRAVYNRAVWQGLTLQRHPFKYVYTGVEATLKRAIPIQDIQRLKQTDLSSRCKLAFARDMFLFSFYTRGMSFVDMAYLRKCDLCGTYLTYKRRKTRQTLHIKWEKNMRELVEKYDIPSSPYLLPIIKPDAMIDVRKQYLYASQNINRHLKLLGRELGFSNPLTLYVARHAWASIAKSKNIPLSVISEGMGHESEATTRIYFASLDTKAVDKANHLILKSLL